MNTRKYGDESQNETGKKKPRLRLEPQIQCVAHRGIHDKGYRNLPAQHQGCPDTS